MTGTGTNGEYVLWCGTVRNKTFAERLRAARAGGFGSMSMFPVDYRAARASGLSDADMRGMLEEGGVRVSTLDPFTKWLPDWEPPAGTSDADLAFVDFDEGEFLGMAEALGVESVTVTETFGVEVRPEVGAECFAAFCDRAAERGLRVHLEFIPWSGVPDLAAAWEIVDLADRPNGGLVFDAWHYFRGRPDDGLLASIPGEKVFVVQLSDARADLRGGSLFEDFFHFRMAPGEGDFDLPGVLGTLARTGGLRSVGAEVFADEFDAMGPEEAGRRAGTSLRSVLAGIERTGEDATGTPSGEEKR